LELLKRQSDAADTFYSIAERIHCEAVVHDNRTRLILTDLRFRYGNYFPFRAVFELDENGRVISERLCHKADMRERIGEQGQPGRSVSAL
jgi:inner membrane protein